MAIFFQIKSLTFGKSVAPLKFRPSVTILSTIHFSIEALVKKIKKEMMFLNQKLDS